MFDVQIDLSEYDRLVTRTQKEITFALPTIVNTAGKEAADYARTHHKHTRRTGHLTNSANLFWEPVTASTKLSEGVLVNVVPYAKYVEHGTKAHWIRPKEGFGFTGPLQEGQSRREITDIGTHRIALRWFVGGRPVFARKVYHPGTDPRPFMQPAAEFARERMLAQVAVLERDIGKIWN